MLRVMVGVVAVMLLCVGVLAVVAGTSVSLDEQRVYERWETRRGCGDRYNWRRDGRDHRPWYK